MSLVTIQRSNTPAELTEDATDGISNNEDYFASKATVILQNQVGRRRSSVIKEGDTLQCNLKKIVELLRKEDSLQLMINLEKVNWKVDGYRYFCLLSRHENRDNGDEYLILGINVSIGRATIGFVLPVFQDMSVTLYGDGGFKIKYKEGEKLFKPMSVHGLWSTVQILNKACNIAHRNNHYLGGGNHSWITHYQNSINSNRAQIAEWNRMLDADTVVNSYLAPQSAIREYVMGTEMDEQRKNEEKIRIYLEEIMRDEDMDNVTVTFLRAKLQSKVSFNVDDYRRFIAEEILIIYGKMDEASNIMPYLYLGSTYNASNLSELSNNGITHILNVTRENENFYRDKFIYKNVEVFDTEETKLMKYFDACYKFINEARTSNGACLVHCQRGISRSATIVISYMMKEFNYTLEEAHEYVKKKRDCIRPNDGFLLQLKTFEGILHASANRHNSKFINEKRNIIKSFPNDFDQIPEKGSLFESPTNFSLSKNKRSSLGNVFHSEFTEITENPDTSAFHNEPNNAYADVYKKSTHDTNLELEDDLSMYHTFCDANVDQSLIDDADLLCDQVHKPIVCESFNEISTTIQSTDRVEYENDNTELTFQTELNVPDLPDQIQLNEKKSVKIKSDHSWINILPDNRKNQEDSRSNNIIKASDNACGSEDKASND